MASGNYGTMISSKGITSPITAMATSVVNAQVDRRSFVERSRNQDPTPYTSGDKHCYGVMKHELVFHTPSENAYMMRNGINDPETSVFSSVNGWKLNKGELRLYRDLQRADPDTARKLRARMNRSICNRLRFIGMSNTSMPDPDSHLSSHCSVTVGGLVTLSNTGPRTLNIGDRVCWDIPSFTTDNESYVPKGTPSDKLLFRTVPYDHLAKSFTLDGLMSAAQGSDDGQLIEDELDKTVNDISGPNCTAANVREVVKSFADTAIELSRELDARVIGVCLRRAEPGEPVDVLMRANKSA